MSVHAATLDELERDAELHADAWAVFVNARTILAALEHAHHIDEVVGEPRNWIEASRSFAQSYERFAIRHVTAMLNRKRTHAQASNP